MRTNLIRSRIFQKWRNRLTSLAVGADLLLTGILGEDAPVNVAEYYDIPLATVHFARARPNGQFIPILSAALGLFAGEVFDRLSWRVTKRTCSAVN